MNLGKRDCARSALNAHRFTAGIRALKGGLILAAARLPGTRPSAMERRRNGAPGFSVILVTFSGVSGVVRSGLWSIFCLCMLLAAPMRAQAPLNLFNGASLLGWNPHGAWSATAGAITTNGGGDRNVMTAVPFGDFDLQFEYNESVPMGAEFRMWATREGSGGVTVDLDISGAKNGVGGIQGVSKSSMATVSQGWHKVQVNASHGTLGVKVDGQPAGSGSGLTGRGGYLGFRSNGTGQLAVRGVRLSPLNLSSDFNGSDLGGWKSIARAPDAKSGVGHSATKVLTLGMGGGNTKPHEAKWTVRSGAIHGEAGPGALEYGQPAEDAVLQLTSIYHGNVKAEDMTALAVRNTPGQMGTGYAVGIGPYAGAVDHLAKHGFGAAGAAVEQTIVIGGRTIATWVNGNLVSVSSDPRPESGDSAQGARTQAGSLQLMLPGDNAQIDVVKLTGATLTKPYGLSPKAPTPPPQTPPPTAGGPVVTPAANPGDSVTANALLQQQKEQQDKDKEEKANKQKVASLMGQAVRSQNPQEQENLYEQVMAIDPANPNAMAGIKDAQAKQQQQQTAHQQVATNDDQEKQRQQQTNTSLLNAQSAFLGGRLSEASRALSIAERLSPGNPLVHELRTRISASQSLRNRLFFLGTGTGVVALLAGISLWWRRRKLQRFPVLEVTSGVDAGRSFRIDKDQTRIGAVPQDGGQRNDIVVRDVEHAISRFHCEVVKRNGQLFLQDLNSSNGTRVDGERLKPGESALLRKGTKIELAGTVELRFGYDRAKKSTS